MHARRLFLRVTRMLGLEMTLHGGETFFIVDDVE
jgi:hypothetical protein